MRLWQREGHCAESGEAFTSHCHATAPSHYDSPAAQARHVLDLTARAWRIPPSSARALARRAPHGHVPLRAMRRLHAAAVLALLPHSW
jgi:hypothetical protein